MIRILIVEDQAVKAAAIQGVLSQALQQINTNIRVVQSAFAAGAALRESSWDLMVLDLNIPMREGEEPRPEGGSDFLRQIQRRGDYHTPTHVVGMSAYPDLLTRYGELFTDLTWVLIEFDQSSDRWRQRLASKALHIAASKNVEANVDYDYDVAIVTALEDPELVAVLDLDASWKIEVRDGDDTLYHTGVFRSNGQSVRVVAAAAVQMGMPATACLAMKMCHHYRPQYIGMCGITAGVKGGYGDVLIADKSWDYGAGKSKAVESSDGTAFGGASFEPAPVPLSLDAGVDARVKHFCTHSKVFREIEVNWPGERPQTPLSYQIGGIASGAAVLENRPLLDAIKSHDRKLIGIEMEAYSVFVVARVCPAPRPKAFVFKSVCDLADQNKNDKFQRYAAYTSAAFAFRFVTDALFGMP